MSLQHKEPIAQDLCRAALRDQRVAGRGVELDNVVHDDVNLELKVAAIAQRKGLGEIFTSARADTSQIFSRTNRVIVDIEAIDRVVGR